MTDRKADSKIMRSPCWERRVATNSINAMNARKKNLWFLLKERKKARKKDTHQDLAFFLAFYLTFYLAFYLAFFLAYYLVFYLEIYLTFYLALRSGSADWDVELAVQAG